MRENSARCEHRKAIFHANDAHLPAPSCHLLSAIAKCMQMQNGAQFNAAFAAFAAIFAAVAVAKRCINMQQP